MVYTMVKFSFFFFTHTIDLKLNADMCSLDSDQALCTEMKYVLIF